MGRIDRTGDVRAAVDRVAGIVEAEHADVLLVAGDLFSELARPDTLRDAVAHWNTTFGPFMARGGTVLAITGNHDNETFCHTLRHAMALAAPLPPPGTLAPTGRFYLATEPSRIRLQAPGDAQAVSFVLMPFPTVTRYPGAADQPSGEKHQTLSALFTRTMADLRAACPQNDPAVLVAHITVRGANLNGGLFRSSTATDVAIDGATVWDTFTYAALGHIHKPQAVGGRDHVRYSGSIERMDLGEHHDSKCVVAGEIRAEGLAGPPREIPIPSTRVYEVNVQDLATDLPELELSAKDPHDLVKLQICYDSAKETLDDVLKTLERLYPRWYAREWRNMKDIGATGVKDAVDPTKSFEETVLTYFERELLFETDAEKAAVVKAIQELLEHFQSESVAAPGKR